MAERRMFAKTIIDSDAFLDMPTSARLLYYDLGMRADDEGFINSPKKIQRMTGASDDDLKVLISKSFVIPFQSGVVVIKHWKIHNYIRKDRLVETVYKEEKSLLETKENGAYTLEKTDTLPDVSQMSVRCQSDVSIGKDSIDKDNISSSNDEAKIQNFDKIWKIYPNKKGKANSIKHWNGWLKGRKINNMFIKLTNNQMYLAVKKYAEECKKNGTEQQYIKHGDTFFNTAILDYISNESNDEIQKEEKNGGFVEINTDNLSPEEYKKLLIERNK